jgi:hypothetical protein
MIERPDAPLVKMTSASRFWIEPIVKALLPLMSRFPVIASTAALSRREQIHRGRPTARATVTQPGVPYPYDKPQVQPLRARGTGQPVSSLLFSQLVISANGLGFAGQADYG